MGRKRVPDPENYCQYCGKKMGRKRYNGRMEDMAIFMKRKYCDMECAGKAHRKESPSGAAYRKRALRYRGSKCQECGSKENLQAHHLDGDITNNSPSNIVTLCASCHAKWHWRNGKTIPKKQSHCRICGKPSKGLNLCLLHYQRYKKYGDPLLTKKKQGSRYVLVREEN